VHAIFIASLPKLEGAGKSRSSEAHPFTLRVPVRASRVFESGDESRDEYAAIRCRSISSQAILCISCENLLTRCPCAKRIIVRSLIKPYVANIHTNLSISAQRQPL
jgi:hypothetical protein